jgi:two-component sensor histidine kinase
MTPTDIAAVTAAAHAEARQRIVALARAKADLHEQRGEATEADTVRDLIDRITALDF